MTNNRKFIIRYFLLIMLLPAMIIVFEMYYEYTNLRSSASIEQVMVERIQEQKEDMIKSILIQNQMKAKDRAEGVKDHIQQKLLESYHDRMDQLQVDLQSRNGSSDAFMIINDSIAGKFMNKDNDDNRIFVVDRIGVIANKSLWSATTSSRDWDQEIKRKINSDLARNAVTMILSKDDRFIYWSTDRKDVGEYAHPTPSIETMIKEYRNNGLQSLSKFNVLVPAYITDTGDIFGTPDVDNSGHTISNQKIIIVQEFNAYDALEPFLHELDKHDDAIDIYKASLVRLGGDYLQSFVIVVGLLFATIIAMLYGNTLLNNPNK